MPPSPTPTANTSRRQLLLGSSVAALAMAAGATVRSSWAAEAAPAGDHAVDVRQFGARGDGQHDDTQAIAQAIRTAQQAQIPCVQLPAGVFVISQTLRLPSHLTLAGAGSGLTTLLAAADTRFDLIRPDPRTADIRQRRTLLTTATAGSAGEQLTHNLTIRGLTIDYHHAPTEGFGSACILIDSAKNVLLHDVAFLRAMPSDHPRSIDQMRGSGFRSECILFANTRHAVMDFCYLVDSGYRPLSVAYRSLDITFQNSIVRAEQPVWRHAFAENHGDGLPRDEQFVHSQMKLLNSTFILEGGTPQDGICSHTGTTHVENCDFFIRGGTDHFNWVLKPFSGSRRCVYLNNRFHCDHEHDNWFGIIGTIGNGPPVNQDLVFSGNIAEVSYAAALKREPAAGGLVDFGVAEQRLTVRDNHLVVRLAGPSPVAIVRVAKARQFSVTGNQVDVTASGAAPDGVLVSNAQSGLVTGNVISGDCQVGVRRHGKLDNVSTAHNVVDRGMPHTIADDSPA